MKLKTLKDLSKAMHFVNLQEGEKPLGYIHIETLKAEAVKWVKEMRDPKDKYICAWIKHFFNITEEDLK